MVEFTNRVMNEALLYCRKASRDLNKAVDLIRNGRNVNSHLYRAIRNFGIAADKVTVSRAGVPGEYYWGILDHFNALSNNLNDLGLVRESELAKYIAKTLYDNS